MSIENNEIILKTSIPIDIGVPKPYLFADTLLTKNYYNRSFKIDNQLFVCKVKQDKPLTKELKMIIESDDTITKNVEIELVNRIRFELGLDEKMTELIKLGRKDREYRRSLSIYPGFRLFANSNIIETAILTLLSQNTTFPDYLNIANKFLNKYGDRVPWDDKLRVFPDFEDILKIDHNGWRTLGATMQARYLAKFTEDTIEDIETYTFYPIFDRGLKGLQKINGIASYTSRILMIYGARRYNLVLWNQSVRDIIEDKFNIKLETKYRFDQWIETRYEKNPALIFHTYFMEYMPRYEQEYDFDNVEIFD